MRVQALMYFSESRYCPQCPITTFVGHVLMILLKTMVG